MLVYTVTKPVGTEDREFEAYTRLLEDVGIDVSDSRGCPSRGRTGAGSTPGRNESRPSGSRRSCDNEQATEVGSCMSSKAPPKIAAPSRPWRSPRFRSRTDTCSTTSPRPAANGWSPPFPEPSSPPPITVPTDLQRDSIRHKGDGWWMELSRRLTGRTEEEIDSLGGVRVLVRRHGRLSKNPHRRVEPVSNGGRGMYYQIGAGDLYRVTREIRSGPSRFGVIGAFYLLPEVTVTTPCTS